MADENVGNMNKEIRVISTRHADSDQYDRQKLIKGWNQEKISTARVLVLGAGAIGNELVKNLAQLGVGKITLVDFDSIVASNLNRCVFFRPSDAKAGLKKAEVLSRRATELNEKVEIIPVVDDIHNVGDEVIKEHEVILSALDNIPARVQACLSGIRVGIPLVDGGILGFYGRVQTVIPGLTPCIACRYSDKELSTSYERFSCSNEYFGGLPFPAVTTMASVIAGIQVNEALKIILGYEQFRTNGDWNLEIGKPLIDKFLIYDAVANSWRLLAISKKPGCLICSGGT